MFCPFLCSMYRYFLSVCTLLYADSRYNAIFSLAPLLFCEMYQVLQLKFGEDQNSILYSRAKICFSSITDLTVLVSMYRVYINTNNRKSGCFVMLQYAHFQKGKFSVLRSFMSEIMTAPVPYCMVESAFLAIQINSHGDLSGCTVRYVS